MDTTTVNFAIERLSEVFQQIKPGALELGSEYVGFVVMKVVLLTSISLGIGFFSVFGALITWHFITDWVEPNPTNMSFIVFFAVSVISNIVFIANLYDAFLATSFPLMYTLETLIR